MLRTKRYSTARPQSDPRNIDVKVWWTEDDEDMVNYDDVQFVQYVGNCVEIVRRESNDRGIVSQATTLVDITCVQRIEIFESW